MLSIAVRIRELASSNLDAAVTRATNPDKMLRLLQTEIEESLVSLHGDLSKGKRQAERLLADAERMAGQAEEWTAKAKTAMDHGREDLARSALLTRDKERAAATAMQNEAGATKTRVDEISQAIEALEAKRLEVRERLANESGAQSGSDCAPAGSAFEASDSKVARNLDRIDRIERRVNYALDAKPEAQARPADIDAEIAALKRDADIDAELAAMKPARKSPAKKKAK